MTSTSATSATAGPAAPGGPGPTDERRRRWGRYGIALAFMAPAFFFLLVWVVYPTIYTIARSFFSDRGRFDEFVGLENYERLFTDDVILTAIKNNALWVAIIPAAVTAFGLLFAVLTERIAWSVAFKFVVFLPLAVSLFAVGVIWRIMYEKDPNQGAVNAAITSVRGVFVEDGVLPDARPSTPDLEGSAQGGISTKQAVEPGADPVLLGLTAISPDDLPEGAEQAPLQPEALQGGITGVVWRDFSPGGGTPGRIEEQEVGIPGVTVELRGQDGGSVASATTNADGTFAFEEVEGGQYQVAIGPKTFAEPFGGVSWLGPRLITPAIMIAYIWATAGFAMVIIAAGLSAIPRDVLEAARTDGASEWQVFRRVTVPLLYPVLTVVFVTQIISVLKIFDLILSIAPGSSRDDATVIAFEMWRKAFSGQNQFGLGAAISTFLLLLFVPFIILRFRSFKREEMA
jgi:alpha-glucoside transport system permease protein